MVIWLSYGYHVVVLPYILWKYMVIRNPVIPMISPYNASIMNGEKKALAKWKDGMN